MTETARLQIRVGNTGVSTAERDLAKLERQGQRTEKATDGFTRSVKLATVALSALGAGVVVSKLARYADEWQNVTNRLKLATEGNEQLATAQEDVFNIAQETRAELSATAELYQRLSLNAGEYIKSQEDLADIVRTVNQTVALSGGSQESATAAITQFNQALASGVLRGEEFNSIMEQAPRLSQALADGLGVGIGQLRKLAGQGELTSKKLLTALRSQARGISDEFADLSPLISQGFSAIDKSATRAIGKLDEMTGASSTVADALMVASGVISTVVDDTEAMQDVMDRAGEAAKVAAAIMAGRLVGALKVSTTETIANIAALRAQGAEELKTAQAATVKAAADKRAAIAAQQSLASTLKLVQAEKTRTTIRTQMAAQATAIVAATNAETAATTRLAAAQKTATITSRALNGSLALLGGPVGVAAIAAIAIYTLADSFETAEEKQRLLRKETDRYIGSLSAMGEVEMNRGQAQIGRQIRELQKERDELIPQLLKLEKDSERIWKGPRGAASSVNRNLENVRNKVRELNEQITQLSTRSEFLSAQKIDFRRTTDRTKNLGSDSDGPPTGSPVKPLPGVDLGGGTNPFGNIQELRDDELESLYDALRTEEEAIEQSYLRRLSIIRQNTEEGGALQQELMERAQEMRDQELQAVKDSRLLEIEAIRESFLTEHELLLEKFEIDRDIILSNTEITENERQNLLLRLNERFKLQQEALERQQAATILKNSEQLYEGLADIAKVFAGEQSTLYKSLFAASKAFSIAEAIVNIQAALAKAANNPFPQNLAAMATVAAQTAGIISTITGTNFAGAFDRGGVIPSGQVGLVGELGPELVEGPAVVTSRKKTAAMLEDGQAREERVEINFNITANDSRSFQQSMVENRDVVEGIVESAFRKQGRRGIA